MATHSSILAWRIPWTEEPGGYSPWGQKESDMTEQPSTHTPLLLSQTLTCSPFQLFRWQEVISMGNRNNRGMPCLRPEVKHCIKSSWEACISRENTYLVKIFLAVLWYSSARLLAASLLSLLAKDWKILLQKTGPRETPTDTNIWESTNEMSVT